MKNLRTITILILLLISNFLLSQSVKNYKNDDYHFKIVSLKPVEVYPGEDGGAMKEFTVNFDDYSKYNITLTAYYFSNKEFSEAIKRILVKNHPELTIKTTENKNKSLLMFAYDGNTLVKAYKFIRHENFCFMLSLEETKWVNQYQKYFSTFSFY